MHLQFPLTNSGIGIMATDVESADFFLKGNIEKLLEEYHFIVIKKLDWTTVRLHTFLEQFGELVKNEKRKDETMLTLDGSQHAKEVLRGTGRMPLHRDGLLMNVDVKYVGIYCLHVNELENGRTYISDSANAFKEYPEEIKQTLLDNGLEAMPFDTTYYLKNENKYYHFDGVISKNNKTLPNGGLHFIKDERASYHLRFSNVDEEKSYEYFETLEKILESPTYTYYHTWETGDLILFDNYYVMHGRESYSGERSLIQMQVKN